MNAENSESKSEPKPEAKPEPAPEAAAAEPSKTPLDNLKGMLAEADDLAKKESTPPAEQSKRAPAGTIPKKEILQALGKIQGFPDEMLSPRQVDSVLKVLIERDKALEIKKQLEQGLQDTGPMQALKDLVAQAKGGTEKQ